jgi:ornithine cyclodeaminase
MRSSFRLKPFSQTDPFKHSPPHPNVVAYLVLVFVLHRAMHRTCISKLAHNMLLLSERDVRQCLSLTECLEVNRKALVALADGTAQVPTRLGIPYRGSGSITTSPSSNADKNSSGSATSTDVSSDHRSSSHHSHHDHSHGHSHDHNHHHPSPSQSAGSSVSAAPNTGDSTKADDWTLFKPAAYSNNFLGMKIVSIRSDNPAKRNLPLVPATVIGVDAETGVVDAIVAGTYLTAARTAAGSALATAHALSLLSNRGGAAAPLKHLVVFGAGLQAELHVQMIVTALSSYAVGETNDESTPSVMKIPMVTIVNRSIERAQALAHKLGDWCDQVSAVALSDEYGVAEALSSSNVIVTATNAVTPLFTSPSLIPPGCHINGIGSYTPTMQEVPSRLVSDRCVVWMDTAEARHVGDLQSLTPHHPAFLLGDVLAEHSHAGKSLQHHLDCTFYKAVGTAIQDVMTADLVVRKARQLELGTIVDMS